MASSKVFPATSVVLYNGATQPFPASAPLIVDDVMGGTLVPGAGAGTGFDFSTLNPNVSGVWFAQPQYSSISNTLQFTRFCEDSTVAFGALGTPSNGKNDFQGWMLQPRVAWLDAKIGTNAGVVDGGQTDQNFEAVSGTWKTTPVEIPLHGTGIFNAHGTGTASARTIGTIPKNRSLCFYLKFMGQSTTSARSEARLIWGDLSNGDKYSLFFSQDMPISLCRIRSSSVTTGGVTTSTTGWTQVFEFSSIPAANVRNGRYNVQICRIAGRLVVVINNQAFWYAERVVGDSASYPNSTSDNDKIIDVVWGTGKVQLDLANCRCRMEMGVLKYATSGGTPFTGSFTKLIKRNQPIDDISAVEKYSAGWLKEGTSNTITVGSGAFSYSATLTANFDGIDTPFLTKCTLRKDAVYTAPNAASLECSGAVRRIKVNQQLPTLENTTGARCTVEFDMLALREICRAAGVGYLDYAVPYRKIDVKLGWIDSSHASTALTPVFRGVVTNFNESLPSFGVHTRTLSCEDMMVLLDKPAGKIKQDSAPLDYYFCRKASGALSNVNQAPNLDGAVVYGFELVREILRSKLGSDIADSIEAWFPGSHYPLMDLRRDRCGWIQLQGALGNQTPFENGFLFPPPYGEHIIDWIRRFQVLDRAVFFISFPEDDRSQWPVPIYARLQHWLSLSGRQTWRAPDNAYITGDVDRMIEYLNAETRYDQDYNYVACWSSPPNSDLGGLLPAVRMSEAYTTRGATAWTTWERALLIENELAYFGGPGVAGVDAIAQIARDELNTAQPIWPDVSLPGNQLMAPGDKLQIVRQLGSTIYGPSDTVSTNYSSPAGIDGLSEITCRIEAIEHNVDLTSTTNPRRFTTTPQIRPLTASGV